MNHTAIILVRAFSNEGLFFLREVIQEFGGSGRIEALSSVYRVSGRDQRPEHVHDLRSYSSDEALTFGLLLNTSYEARQCLRVLQQIEKRFHSESMRRGVKLLLVFFDDLTVMTPDLTLPYADFHERPDLVVPAAEICPDLIHPVLHKTLREIGEGFAAGAWGEFFAQGKSVLDFRPPGD